jgi:hypothetical protein
MAASGLEADFIKLSDAEVAPCRACKRCVEDNLCKVNDGFPDAAAKLREADAVVLGGYVPYGTLDAFTKAFLERLWSMRHVRGENRGRIFITVASGLSRQGRDAALDSMATVLAMEGARHVARLHIEGNVPCLTCGRGDDCWGSGVPRLHPGKKASADLCAPVEDQPVWDEAAEVGEILRRHFAGEPVKLPSLTFTPQMG